MLTVGSLFAGIGGFDLGLERAGMRSVWQCEIDPYCQRVLAKHWPDVLRVPDVRDVRADTVPRVDVICGGFPCQDISIAGAGAGLAGARSGLWSEYARIVGELRPRYVVVENVSALLARGLGTVLADLAALGYDAEWDCIPASAVGAPHRRDRVWVVAYPGGEHGGSRGPRGSAASGAREPVAVGALQVADSGCERGESRGGHRDMASASRAGEAEGPERQRDGDAPDDRGADVAHADDAGREQRRRPEPVRAQQPAPERGGQDLSDADELEPRLSRRIEQQGEAEEGRDVHQWTIEPDVGRVADGIPARVDRLRSLGNSLVPQIAEWLGRRILDYEAGGLSGVA